MKKFYILSALFVLFAFVANAQLTGITPNQGINYQTLQTSITSNGLFLQSSSPSGNIYNIRIFQGAYSINMFDFNNWWITNTTVINPDSVTTELIIPLAAPAGAYDLEVITGDVMFPWMNQTTYTLPGAFTVLPPDGYITGTVYDDVNRNGIQDIGDPVMTNQQVKLLPGNSILTTDAFGNYSFPVPNGNYSITYVPAFSDYKFVSSLDTIPVTINNANSPDNDFGLIDALVSVIPNTGYQGLSSTHQLVSDKPIFVVGGQPNGNVSLIYINSSPPNLNIYAPGITVIDSYTCQFVLSIPIGYPVGSNHDIRVSISGSFNGLHWLKDQFNIATPQAFVSGHLFFDQNQNQVSDPGEPGIPGGGVILTPDNSMGIADAFGNFLLGSNGGVQVLTPTNNIPDLVLFTDSASYTFVATGNITGKDFGFISTNPDYTIDVSGFYIFPRCNSNQLASFVVKNNSNVTYDLIAWIKPDPLMTYVSAPIPPSSISNDTLYWNLTLDPYETATISATFHLPTGGTVLTTSYGAISLNPNGSPNSYDESVYVTTTICSMDPNDKAATPPGIFLEHFTLMTDTLEYLIRFQNTGTDTAFNVVVLDTLDNDLDFSTFQILGSSHSMITELEGNGALKFTFNNIMLVDSNANEPESHGYIMYRIRANSSLPDSTPVNNTGYIYFDFNAAVLTNTTLNTLVYVLPVGIAEIKSENGITIYPNPFNQYTTMIFDNPSGDKYELFMTDITGKVVGSEMNTYGNMFVIEKDKMSSGMYFYNLVNLSKGSSRSGKILVE